MIKNLIYSVLCFIILFSSSSSVFGSINTQVSDNDQLELSAAFSISLLVSDYNGVGVSCNGASDGSIDMTITGGTGPFDILWSTTETTGDISLLGVGTYSVRVIDAVNDTVIDSVAVTEPSIVSTVFTDVQSPLCNGDSNGSIDITPSGGVGGYTYLWSNGSTTQDLALLDSSVYSITVTDLNGCTAESDTLVDDPDPLSILTSSVDANGAINGQASVIESGGTPTYTYLWSNSETTSTITGLLPGTYTITVTDNNGCIKIDSAIVSNAQGLCAVISDSVIQVSCYGLSDGAIYISSSAAIPPVSYVWSNGATTQDITGLVQGTYSVTMTDTSTCTDTISFFVSQPDTITLSLSSTPDTCANSNGTASVFSSGGNGLYTYLWSDGATSATINSKVSGIYTVTVTDQNLCVKSDTVFIAALNTPLAILDSVVNVLCNGGTTGGVYISVSGGQTPYTYLWNTGATTQDIAGVGNGNYTVTVTDANLCTSVVNAGVSQPAALNDSIQKSSATCGLPNGSITVFPYNGTPGYTFLWSSGQTTQTVTGLVAGNYTVTISDANGCTRQRSTNLSNISGAVAVLDSAVNILCNGGNTGGVYISVSGGQTPYTYLWNTSATTQDLTGVGIGNYTVTVTDASTCISTVSGSTSQPTALNDSIQKVNATCGQANGSITVFPYNGTPGYTYLWSTGQTAQGITNLVAGLYTVTVTDANGCIKSEATSINSLNGPAASIDSVRHVKCNGDASGGIFISVINGVPPYSYLWTNGTTTQDLTNVLAGTHNVTITDDNNCQISLFATISQPPSLSAPSQVVNASCGLPNGSATINPSGGVSPYTYLWSNGQTTQTATGLIAGTHTVTVTDANLCTRTRNVSISSVPGPSLSTDSVVNILCNGAVTGAIYVGVSSGTTPYSYAWSNGATTQDITNIVAGTYTLTVLDGGGCTVQLTETVTQLPALNDSIQITTANCGAPTGSATVFAFGGTLPYTYLWSTSQTTMTIFNLNAGSYVVTLTDFNGCSKVDVANISNIGGPSVIVDSIVNVKCFGENDGGIYITVSGGTTPYDYLWSNGATSQDLLNESAGTYTVTISDNNNCSAIVSSTIGQPTLLQDSANVNNPTCSLPNGAITIFPYGGTAPYSYLWNGGQTTQSINSLSPASYAVTISDFNGCTEQFTTTLTNVAGAQLQLDSIHTVECFSGSDGDIFITPAGGTGPFSYLWSTGVTTQDIQNLVAGIYTVTVTDANGCTDQLVANVTQPSQINVSPIIIPEACNNSNGSVAINPSGGFGPYTYFWSNSQTTQNIIGLITNNYTVTVTDSRSCNRSFPFVVGSVAGPSIITDSIELVSCNGLSNGGVFVSINSGTPPYTYQWSSGQTTQDINGQPFGTYTLTVTDDRSCSVQQSFTITQPDILQVSLTGDSTTCGLANGTVVPQIQGGTLSYNYLWSSGQTTSFISGLNPGAYTLTVTDANGCIESAQTLVGQTPLLSINLDSSSNISCNGLSDGSIFISISDGNGPFQYLWSNSATTQDLSNLSSGSYTVTVTDFDNCIVNSNYNIGQPDVLADSVDVTEATCSTANGAATVFPYGGTSPYTYLWNSGQTTQSISGLLAGSYTVTVTDLNNCSIVSNVLVPNLGGPVISTDTIISVTCNGFSNGSILLTVSSGTPPLNFAWSSGQTTEDISGIGSGTYTLTVTDQNLCVQFQSFIVDEPDQLQDSITVEDAHCGNSDGSIIVYPYGGTSPYTYLWSNTQTTQQISGLIGGVYTVTITDDNGCVIDSSINVLDLPAPSLVLDSVLNNLCAADSAGAIYISISGGTAPYQYQWSNGATIQDITGLPLGVYTVTVTDFYSCSASISQSVSQPDTISATFTSTPSSCNDANGSITTSVSGGLPGYSYLWSNGATTAIIDSLGAGLYTLTITDLNNCEAIFNASVNNISAPTIAVIDSANVTCSGLSDGFIRVEVNGGTPPYVYSWTNTAQTGDLIFGLSGNLTYTLSITDSLNCVTILSVFISEPDPIVLSTTIPQLNGIHHISCNGNNDGSIDLSVSGGVMPYVYQWSNFATTEDISSLFAGTYTVTVTDTNNCNVTNSFVLTQPQLLSSNAGSNNVICGTDSDTLNANIPLSGAGYWTVISGSAVFSDTLDPKAIVTSLGVGSNVLQWVVTDGVCTSVSQVVISVNTNVQAIPGINRDVCENSVLLTAVPPQFGFGYWQVISSLSSLEDSTLSSTLATGLNSGSNVFQWTVINGTCRDSALVNIFLNDPSDCVEILELPTGFTPNGDGKNDYLIVKGLDDFLENSLMVFNRWGNKVYEKSNYRNDWDGVSNSGNPLPAGTYFVIFKARAVDKIVTSYIDLRR